MLCFPIHVKDHVLHDLQALLRNKGGLHLISDAAGGVVEIVSYLVRRRASVLCEGYSMTGCQW
jgi:hypothetical protein